MVQIEELLSNIPNGIIVSCRISVWATNCRRALCESICPLSGNVCRKVPSENRWARVTWSARFRTYGNQHRHSDWFEVNNFRTSPAQAQHRMLVQFIRRESTISATNGVCRKVGTIGLGQSNCRFATTTWAIFLILFAMNVAPWISEEHTWARQGEVRQFCRVSSSRLQRLHPNRDSSLFTTFSTMKPARSVVWVFKTDGISR